MHVINHLNGQENKTEKRNIMVESARIARGDIKPLDELNAKDWDALFIPGGLGIGKNLSDFGKKGEDFAIEQDVEAVIKDFHESGKYLGLT